MSLPPQARFHNLLLNKHETAEKHIKTVVVVVEMVGIIVVVTVAIAEIVHTK